MTITRRHIAALLLVFALVAGVGGWYLLAEWERTALARTCTPSGARVIEVPAGAPSGLIIDRAAPCLSAIDRRIVRRAVSRMGLDRRFQSGEYEFVEGLSVMAALRQIANGRVKTYPVTIPEGFRVTQIEPALEAAFDWLPKGTFAAAALDPAAPARFGIQGAPHLEGYLYPATYRFSRGTGVQAMIAAMVKKTLELDTPERKAAAAKLGFSFHQLLTLASIVEKETGLPAERPLIAAVFLNRLRKDMLLQTDPTIIYGLTDYTGDIRRRDILNPHKYNTYVHKGLPPGPIASPGVAAVDAVLNPTPTEYLYFVATGDGGHRFSVTLREHEAAVKQWMARERGNRK